MTILVTGAAGFVGQHLCRALIADGEEVVGTFRDIDLSRPLAMGLREVSRDSSWPPGTVSVHRSVGTVVQGDLRDLDLCKRIVTDYEVDAIYHLAAHSIVSVCAEAPDVALEVAVMGTARLLEAVRSVKRPVRVVVMSSDKAYGDAPSPYTEETPLDPRGAYDASKACQDIVARMYAWEYGLDVRVVRAVNIYGPGDPNPSRLIPRTVARLKVGEPPVINVGAHAMKRQYVYVDDLVRALRMIGEERAKRIAPKDLAWCVGSPDEPMTAADVIKLLRQIWVEVTGQSVLDELEYRDSSGFREIASQQVDDAKLRGIGWEPMVRIREGLRRVIEEAMQ